MSLPEPDLRRIETHIPSASDPAPGRQAIFRSALESYIADYRNELAPTVAVPRHRWGLIREIIRARLAQLSDRVATRPSARAPGPET